MTSTALEVLARMKANHAPVCGTEAGYRQISKARTRMRKLGARVAQLPEYDEACKVAWANAGVNERAAVKAGEKRSSGRRPVEREHGSLKGLNQHYNERAKLRRQGVKLADLPEICAPCQLARVTGLKELPKREPEPPPLAGQNARHGTEERLDYELLMQRRARQEDRPEHEIEALMCDDCRRFMRLRRIKRRLTLGAA